MRILILFLIAFAFFGCGGHDTIFPPTDAEVSDGARGDIGDCFDYIEPGWNIRCCKSPEEKIYAVCWSPRRD